MELSMIRLREMPRLSYHHQYDALDDSVTSYMDPLDLVKDDNYQLSKVRNGHDHELTLHPEHRNSWTYNHRLWMEIPMELTPYSCFYSKHVECEWIKYKPGGRFSRHCDDQMNQHHQYTCLIFGLFEQEDAYFEGGELVFTHPDGLYHITIDVAKEVARHGYIAVIFSIHMVHEVLPVKSGTRYVLKMPWTNRVLSSLGARLGAQKQEQDNPDELIGDGGFQSQSLHDY